VEVAKSGKQVASGSWRTEDEGSHALGGVGLHAGRHVLVNGLADLHRVTEAAGHDGQPGLGLGILKLGSSGLRELHPEDLEYPVGRGPRRVAGMEHLGPDDLGRFEGPTVVRALDHVADERELLIEVFPGAFSSGVISTFFGAW
jgi:hypothetical protein